MKLNILNFLIIIAKTLITLLIIFLCLEVFARIYFFKPIALLPKYGNSIIIRNENFPKRACESNACKQLISMKFKPNSEFLFKFKKFKTNSYGLRDKEYDLIKPINTYRVAVIGASFTIAAGVDVEKSYHGLLEDFYNKSSDKKYEFINFGGYGGRFEHVLTSLKQQVLKFKPDHILIQLPSGTFKEFQKPIKGFIEFTRNPYFRFWFPQLKRYYFKKDEIQKYNKVDRKRMTSLMHGEKEKSGAEEILKEIKAIASKENMKVTFVYLSLENENIKPAYIKFVTKMLAELRFPYIDTSSKFENISLKSVQLYRLDQHPNERGHYIFSEAIKEKLLLD